MHCRRRDMKHMWNIFLASSFPAIHPWGWEKCKDWSFHICMAGTVHWYWADKPSEPCTQVTLSGHCRHANLKCPQYYWKDTLHNCTNARPAVMESKNQWTWWYLYCHISHINRKLRNNECETQACHQQICGICPFVRNSVPSAIQCECYCPSNVSSHTPWMLFMYTKDFGLAPTLQGNVAFFTGFAEYTI